MADNVYKVVGLTDLESGRLKVLMTHDGQGCSMTLPEGVDHWRSGPTFDVITIGSEGVEMTLKCRSNDERERLVNYLSILMNPDKEIVDEAEKLELDDDKLNKAIAVFEKITGLKLVYMDVEYHEPVKTLGGAHYPDTPRRIKQAGMTYK
jgi:hypothetical protein